MMNNNNYFAKLDNLIYTFVINVISLLKSLKKENVENEKTAFLSKKTKELSSVFNIFFDNKEKVEFSDEIKNSLFSLIEQIKEIIIPEFEDVNRRIIHEKSEILFHLNKIEELIKSFNN